MTDPASPDMLDEDDRPPAPEERPATWPLIEDRFGYAEWTPEYGIDEFVVESFTCGGCEEFALALQERFGYTMRTERGSHGTIAHTWAVAPDGRAIDVLGVHPGPLPPGTSRPDAIESRAAADIARDGIVGDLLAWARDVIAAFPDFYDAARRSAGFDCPRVGGLEEAQPGA